MTEISRLLAGHRSFRQKYFVDNPELYRRLHQDGQSPKVLVIACSDSRVDPSIILGAEPGDLFVIRNVANIVPPYEHDLSSCHGTSAAIEYAVNHLQVEDIVILGHSHCGGIRALVDDRENDHTFIDNWIYIVEDAKFEAAHRHLDHEESCAFCEKAAIGISLHNLETFPFVKEKLAAGKLRLHGWYFSIETGTLETVETR